MSHVPTADSPTDRAAADTARSRKCLRCAAVFQSEWAGERICARCKNTTAWRAGTPLRSHSAGPHK
jgi:hypothetical protein